MQLKTFNIMLNSQMVSVVAWMNKQFIFVNFDMFIIYTFTVFNASVNTNNFQVTTYGCGIAVKHILEPLVTSFYIL